MGPKMYYSGNKVKAFAQMSGDYLFRCGTRELAAISANNVKGNVYLYNFAHLSTVDIGYYPLQLAGIKDKKWASHSAEIIFVFGNVGNIPSYFPTEDDVALAKEIMTLWTNFAKYGNPNSKWRKEANFWTPVPTKISAFLDRASNVPTFLLQAGGSKMVDGKKKMQQCSAFPLLSALRSSDGKFSQSAKESVKSDSPDSSARMDSFRLGMNIMMLCCSLILFL